MSSWRHDHFYDTHHGVVINRVKFDACTCSSFRGVKTDTQTHRQTDRIVLYILDMECHLRLVAIITEVTGRHTEHSYFNQDYSQIRRFIEL